MPDQYDSLFKFLIVGPAQSGKSCLLLRYADDFYTDQPISTIGVDYKTKIIKVNSKTIKLQIWDQSIDPHGLNNSSIMRGIHGIILVVDLTKSDELLAHDLQEYSQSINLNKSEKATVFCVGAKADLCSGDQNARLGKLINDHADFIGYCTVSSKADNNIETPFHGLAKSCLLRASDQVGAKKDESAMEVPFTVEDFKKAYLAQYRSEFFKCSGSRMKQAIEDPQLSTTLNFSTIFHHARIIGGRTAKVLAAKGIDYKNDLKPNNDLIMIKKMG